MTKTSKFVGLDVHKISISIAWCEGGARSEAVSLGKVEHDVARLLKKLRLGFDRSVPITRPRRSPTRSMC